MKASPDGTQFVDAVSKALGTDLHFQKWVGKLYDVCTGAGSPGLFDDLVFQATGFQRIYRVLNSGTSEDSIKSRLAVELRKTLETFSTKLSEAIGKLPEADIAAFQGEFFLQTGGAFENMRKLIEDFSGIKRYYLILRDQERK